MVIKRIAKTAVASLKKSISFLKALLRFWLPVVKLEELDPAGDKPRVLAYAGYSKAQKIYLGQRFFSQKAFKVRFSGFKGFWQLTSRRRRQKLAADILIAEASFLTVGFYLKKEGYVMPEFVDMKIDIRDPMAVMKKRNKSDFSDVERLIRKYQWKYSVTRDMKAYHDFFYEMYLPYLKSRYTERAIITSYRQFQELCRSGFLLCVHRDEAPVAGVLVVLDKDHVSLNRLGIKDGNIDYLKQGAIGAMYYFSILECQKLGYGELILGGTYPFLSDGLTRYKKGLNGEFILSYEKSRNHLWVMSGDSVSAREFFSQNPFICLGRDLKLRETYYH